jgi:dUTP pyrophosphatase
MSITYNIAPFIEKNNDKQNEFNTCMTIEFYNNHNVNYKKDIGCDLFCFKDITVPANAISFKIGLGICASAYIKEDLSSYMIFPRSSMGAKTPLRLCNSIGLVDPEYTGELLLFVDNMSNEPYEIKNKDRLVQLVGPSHEFPRVILVEKLKITNRNTNGIGSSGR